MSVAVVGCFIRQTARSGVQIPKRTAFPGAPARRLVSPGPRSPRPEPPRPQTPGREAGGPWIHRSLNRSILRSKFWAREKKEVGEAPLEEAVELSLRGHGRHVLARCHPFSGPDAPSMDSRPVLMGRGASSSHLRCGTSSGAPHKGTIALGYVYIARLPGATFKCSSSRR